MNIFLFFYLLLSEIFYNYYIGIMKEENLAYQSLY